MKGEKEKHLSNKYNIVEANKCVSIRNLKALILFMISKYIYISFGLQIRVDISGRQARWEQIKRERRGDREIVDLDEVLKIEDVPFAEKLRGFILYKSSNTNSYNIYQSGALNDRVVNFLREKYKIIIFL